MPTLFRVPLALLLVLSSSAAFGQQVFVLCEGAQDFTSGEILEAPRVGWFDASEAAPTFEVLHVLEGSAFAVDAILTPDGQELYVSGEDVVLRLDANTGEVLAQQAVEGAGSSCCTTGGFTSPVAITTPKRSLRWSLNPTWWP